MFFTMKIGPTKLLIVTFEKLFNIPYCIKDCCIANVVLRPAFPRVILGFSRRAGLRCGCAASLGERHGMPRALGLREAALCGFMGLALLAAVSVRHVATRTSILEAFSDAGVVDGTLARDPSMEHPINAQGTAYGYGGTRWARSGASVMAPNEV